MANSKIPNLNLSDTLNTQRLKFNQLLDSVGDVSTLTTTGTNVTAAVNELDAELGTISAGAMGTTASTVSGAIAELDGRLDSINTTELLSLRATLSDSSATSIVRGNLQVDTNLHVNGNTTMSGTLTVDGQVTFKAGSDNNIALGDAATDTITLTGEVNSNIIPDGNNDYDLGSETKQWRHVYVDGTVNADNVAADSATIGTLTVTGDTTLNNTITVQDSAYITGDLDLGSNLDVAGNVNVIGTVVSEGALTVEDSAYVTGNLDVGGNVTVVGDTTFANTITVQDSAYVTGNLDVGGNVNVTGTVVAEGALTVEDSAYVTGNLDVGGALTAGTTTLGSTTASSVAVSDLTNNRVVIAGTSGELEDDLNLTYDGTDLSTNSLKVTDLTDNRILVAGTGGAVEDDENLTWNGSLLDITGDLSVSAGFTVGGTFTTTGNTRGQAAYVVVNDGVTVANGNRAGLAVDRPTTDSAVIQWNELGDYWEAGTTAGVERLALQTDSAAFHNLYAGGTLTVAGNTTLKNALTVQDSAYITSDLVVGGNFTVNGTTTFIDTTTVEIQDNVMLINSNQTGTPSTALRSGLEVERGSSTNINLQWNELNDYWEAAEDGSNTLGRVATSGWLSATAPISYNSSTGNFSHDSSGVSPGTYGSVTVDATGHVTGGTNPTYDNYVSWTLSGDGGSNQTIASGNTVDIAGGTYITTTAGATDTLTVAHDNTSRSNTTTAATLAHSDAFEVVDSIQSNATGHITGVNTRTITLPAGAVPNDAAITISGGTDLETGGTFTVDQSDSATITLNHSNVTRTNVSASESPGSAGSFDVVDSIQTSATGHVTQVGTRTITLPASATYSAGNDLDLSGNTFNIESELNFVNSINYTSGDFTLASSGDIYIKPTGDDVFMQGTTSGEELKFNLGASEQTITASDNLAFATDLQIFEFKAETSDTTSRPPEIRIVNTDTGPNDGDSCGSITFRGENTLSQDFVYGGIECKMLDVSYNTEDGDLNIYNMFNGTKKSVLRGNGSATTLSGGYISLVSTGSMVFDVNGTGYYTSNAENQPSASSGGFRHFMVNNPSSVTSNGDISHELIFQGYNGSGFASDFARIKIGIVDATNGSEDGKLEIFTEKAGSNALCATFEDTNLTVQGDITSISDIRTKENVETIGNGLEIVESLRGVYYNKIGEEDRKVGVIAQETEEVLPEVVLTDQEGMKSVDYGKMVGVLIEAIKDLKAEVEELKANKCNCGE